MIYLHSHVVYGVIIEFLKLSHVVYGVVAMPTNDPGALAPRRLTAMSVRVYSEINLHITWHTKNSLPMIKAAMEPTLHQFLKDKVIETPGAYFHAIGGIGVHIHLATTVKPSIHLDEWIAD